MSEGQAPPKNPGDLTGLFQLPADTSAPNPSNTPTPTEPIDAFESIDQLEMMDHAPYEAPPQPSIEETEIFQKKPPSPAPTIDDIQNYSDQKQGLIHDLPVYYPFHLLITGEFGPYERDKLLWFITENPIGTTSAELDLQIKGGRVLLPRISEFAGIKMIQDLRDSGLQFSLTPSSRDPDESIVPDAGNAFRYQGGSGAANPSIPIPILTWKPEFAQIYQEIDTIEVTQYFKAEMVEAEKSELFQEVVDRMKDSLRQKARYKGGDAITQVVQKLLRLRLPSQYQVSIQAVVLKNK